MSERMDEARKTGAVVVVDDDRVDRRVAERCLGRSKLADRAVTALSSGEQLLALLEEVNAGQAPRPALLLLDLSMPRITGLELLARIRADPRLKDEPFIVVLSTSQRDDDRRRALELGAQRYEAKPSSSGEYVALFDSLVPVVSARCPASSGAPSAE